MNAFSITYETVTPESAEHGETDDFGFLHENLTFREAIDFLQCCLGCHVEADCFPVRGPRWFTFYKAEENYSTGSETSYSLHLPDNITEPSRQRIARLVGCYGVKR